jgi:Coenzyme PQQ synthesis protein D (PqqD)
MSFAGRFRVNNEQVVHETFEDEVLVVNFDTGTYYSLLGASARIWLWIVDGATTEAILRALADTYEGEAGAIEVAATEFIGKLGAENLILADQTGATGNAVPLAPSTAKTPFVPPELQIFTDMQDLLLLDPVHEVEDAGWPVAKPQPQHQTKS